MPLDIEGAPRQLAYALLLCITVSILVFSRYSLPSVVRSNTSAMMGNQRLDTALTPPYYYSYDIPCTWSLFVEFLPRTVRSNNSAPPTVLMPETRGHAMGLTT